MIITIGSRVKDKDGKTYLLTEELGHGGFGCVYKAVRDSDKALYAVKTLLYSFANEEAVNSFKNEIILSGKISGENVIHYVYAHDGEAYPELPPYIIMEYANGGTLKDRISERKANNTPFSKEELMSIYKQLIDGMTILIVLKNWYILRNKNNGIYLTSYEPMKEPFAFAVDALGEAIKGVEAMSLYTSSVEPYTEETFLGYIAELIQR